MHMVHSSYIPSALRLPPGLAIGPPPSLPPILPASSVARLPPRGTRHHSSTDVEMRELPPSPAHSSGSGRRSVTLPQPAFALQMAASAAEGTAGVVNRSGQGIAGSSRKRKEWTFVPLEPQQKKWRVRSLVSGSGSKTAKVGPGFASASTSGFNAPASSSTGSSVTLTGPELDGAASHANSPIHPPALASLSPKKRALPTPASTQEDGRQKRLDSKRKKVVEQEEVGRKDLHEEEVEEEEEEEEEDEELELEQDWEGVYRCQALSVGENEGGRVCGGEVVYGECSSCGAEWEVNEGMRKVDYELDVANLPLLASADRLPPSPPSNDLLTVDQKSDKAFLLSLGTTPAMIDRYRLSYRSDIGLVAIADAPLRNLFSIHPREIIRRTTADGMGTVETSRKRPWQIHLGRCAGLNANDEDGSRFLEAFLDEIVDSQAGFSPLSGENDEQPEERWVTVVETFEKTVESGDDSEEEQAGSGAKASETRVSAWVTRRLGKDEELEDDFDVGEVGAVDGLLIDDSAPSPSLEELQKALKGSSPSLPDNVVDTLPAPIAFSASAQHRFSTRLDKVVHYRIDIQPEAPKPPLAIVAPVFNAQQKQTPPSPGAEPVEKEKGAKKRLDEASSQLHPPAATPFVQPRQQQSPILSLNFFAKDEGKKKTPVAALGEGVAPPAAAPFRDADFLDTIDTENDRPDDDDYPNDNDHPEDYDEVEDCFDDPRAA